MINVYGNVFINVGYDGLVEFIDIPVDDIELSYS
jgi:hypothetical protein